MDACELVCVQLSLRRYRKHREWETWCIDQIRKRRAEKEIALIYKTIREREVTLTSSATHPTPVMFFLLYLPGFSNLSGFMRVFNTQRRPLFTALLMENIRETMTTRGTGATARLSWWFKRPHEKISQHLMLERFSLWDFIVLKNHPDPRVFFKVIVFVIIPPPGHSTKRSDELLTSLNVCTKRWITTLHNASLPMLAHRN